MFHKFVIINSFYCLVYIRTKKVKIDCYLTDPKYLSCKGLFILAAFAKEWSK